jgi:hypothetical protein
LLPEIIDYVRIIRAASSHLDFIDTTRRTPTLIRFRYRLSRNSRDGGYAVFRSCTTWLCAFMLYLNSVYLRASILSQMSSAILSPKVSPPVVFGMSCLKYGPEKRTTLPAQRHARYPEIAHCRDTSLRCDDRYLRHVKMGAHLISFEEFWEQQMPDLGQISTQRQV